MIALAASLSLLLAPADGLDAVLETAQNAGAVVVEETTSAVRQFAIPRKPDLGWRTADWTVYGATIAARAGDLATTTLLTLDSSCRGKVSEANPLVSFAGRDAVPAVLLSYKLVLIYLTPKIGDWTARRWIAWGGTPEGARRARRVMMGAGAVVDVGATVWNARLWARECTG